MAHPVSETLGPSSPVLLGALLLTLLSLRGLSAERTSDIRGTSDLRARIGERVALVGRVSETPWQHMIRGDLEGRTPEYFDLEDRSQIVVYASGGLTCEGPLLLRGTVLLTEGSSKRPGSKEIYSEVQLDVTSSRCLDGKGLEALVGGLVGERPPAPGAPGAADDLLAAGALSIPVLLAHLSDPRLCRTERVLTNEGELMNRPPNAPPAQERWDERKVTVGGRCEEILYALIAPEDWEPPGPAQFKPLSPGSRAFRIRDWEAWWERNRAKGLAQIREEMKPVLDAYWKSRGVEQVVE